MGSEDEVEQSLGRPFRQTTAGPSGHANSPHPSPREGHHSTARWSSSVLLSDMVLPGGHAAAAACCRVQQNSVPSTHIRCMITASRRASATIARFMPRRLATCIAQALSQDHFLERNMAAIRTRSNLLARTPNPVVPGQAKRSRAKCASCYTTATAASWPSSWRTAAGAARSALAIQVWSG